jgi:hypothetical protein
VCSGWTPRCWLDVLHPCALLLGEVVERFQEHGAAQAARPGATRCLQVLLAALEGLGQQQVEAADRRRYQQLMQALRAVGRWGSRGSTCSIRCSECLL